jgi:catechol 2,3-dioxygenase-like lactoylglutathione lyase family enzyme
MNVRRVVPNVTTDRLEESRDFYTGLLGFEVGMDMGWIVTLVSPDQSSAQISLVRGKRKAPASADLTLTVEVGDVDAVFAEATSRGYRIVYPLTDEPWGVRRFHVTDPNGVLINVMSHIPRE